MFYKILIKQFDNSEGHINLCSYYASAFLKVYWKIFLYMYTVKLLNGGREGRPCDELVSHPGE